MGTQGILSAKRSLSRVLRSAPLRACPTLQNWRVWRRFLHFLLQASGGRLLAESAGSGRRHWGKQDAWVQSTAPLPPSPRTPDVLDGDSLPSSSVPPSPTPRLWQTPHQTLPRNAVLAPRVHPTSGSEESPVSSSPPDAALTRGKPFSRLAFTVLAFQDMTGTRPP